MFSLNLRSLSRLSLKRFEIVEPSLQAIFVAVVGGKETLEKAAAQSIDAAPARSSQRTSQPVRKELFGFLTAAVVLPVVAVMQFMEEEPNLGMIALWGAIALYTGYRYVRARQKAANQAASGGTP